jgi:hypothetical protein
MSLKGLEGDKRQRTVAGWAALMDRARVGGIDDILVGAGGRMLTPPLPRCRCLAVNRPILQCSCVSYHDHSPSSHSPGPRFACSPMFPSASVIQPLCKALLATPTHLLSFRIGTNTLRPDSPALRHARFPDLAFSHCAKEERGPVFPQAVRVRDVVSEWAVRRDGEGQPDGLVDGSGGGDLVVSVMEGAVAAEVGTEFVGVGEGGIGGMIAIVFEFAVCWG